MSNVINFPASVSAPPVLSIPQELDYEVRSAPALFEPIKGAGVVDGLGYQNFRTDTEQALGAVQERYKIVQNSELFASLAQALEGAAPARALEGAKIKPSISYGGRQAFADIAFPQLTEDLVQARGNATALTFRLLLWNSFDGSSPVRLAAGAIDGFCSNGMIFGSYDLFGRRHTKGFNQKDLSDFVGNSFVLFQEKITELRRETFAPIELTQAEEFLKKNFSDRRAAQLLERFAVEAQERGATVWALRSALTYYASHNSSQFAVRNTGQDSSAAVLYGRENEIASLFVGAGWRELLAA
jgi:hypothetical protein